MRLNKKKITYNATLCRSRYERSWSRSILSRTICSSTWTRSIFPALDDPRMHLAVTPHIDCSLPEYGAVLLSYVIYLYTIAMETVLKQRIQRRVPRSCLSKNTICVFPMLLSFKSSTIILVSQLIHRFTCANSIPDSPLDKLSPISHFDIPRQRFLQELPI